MTEKKKRLRAFKRKLCKLRKRFKLRTENKNFDYWNHCLFSEIIDAMENY